jgi:hypothetical protein
MLSASGAITPASPGLSDSARSSAMARSRVRVPFTATVNPPSTPTSTSTARIVCLTRSEASLFRTSGRDGTAAYPPLRQRLEMLDLVGHRRADVADERPYLSEVPRV